MLGACHQGVLILFSETSQKYVIPLPDVVVVFNETSCPPSSVPPPTSTHTVSLTWVKELTSLQPILL